MPIHRREFRFILSAAFAALFAFTGYLVLRPSPSMAEIGWFPGWLSNWADRYGDLRTAVPFFLLSLMWTMVSWARVKRLIAGYYGIGALLVLTELCQIFLPERHAGLPDILYGLIGLSAGGLVGLIILSKAQAAGHDGSISRDEGD